MRLLGQRFACFGSACTHVVKVARLYFHTLAQHCLPRLHELLHEQIAHAVDLQLAPRRRLTTMVKLQLDA